MVLEPRKDALRNFIIVSLAVPLRHHLASCRVNRPGVAFAKVNAKCDFRENPQSRRCRPRLSARGSDPDLRHGHACAPAIFCRRMLCSLERRSGCSDIQHRQAH